MINRISTYNVRAWCWNTVSDGLLLLKWLLGYLIMRLLNADGKSLRSWINILLGCCFSPAGTTTRRAMWTPTTIRNRHEVYEGKVTNVTKAVVRRDNDHMTHAFISSPSQRWRSTIIMEYQEYPGLLNWANSVRQTMANDPGRQLFKDQVQIHGISFLVDYLDNIISGQRQD